MSKHTMNKEVDQYIQSFPESTQKILKKIRRTIRRLAPSATELISYGIPTYQIEGENVVHFAAYKKHIGFYPSPQVIEKFHKHIEGYKNAKGSVQFPLDAEIPYDLIQAMTEYRLKQCT